VSRIRVSTVIDAPPATVWDVIEDISSHELWMHDVTAIRFTSRRTSGVGTTFDCETRLGPFSLTDRMEVTSWRPRRRMGVRHVGVVTGSGTFTLKPVRARRGEAGGRRGRTRFTWKERLHFPWWMGGPIGGLLGARVLHLVWRRNLRSLAKLVEVYSRDRHR
jgi:hypothetical protein